jgi:general nucleoside transport system ATP-binding protein
LLSLADQVAVIHRGRLSPLMPRAAVTVRQLGLAMAGHWEELPDVA